MELRKKRKIVIPVVQHGAKSSFYSRLGEGRLLSTRSFLSSFHSCFLCSFSFRCALYSSGQSTISLEIFFIHSSGSNCAYSKHNKSSRGCSLLSAWKLLPDCLHVCVCACVLLSGCLAGGLSDKERKTYGMLWLLLTLMTMTLDEQS